MLHAGNWTEGVPLCSTSFDHICLPMPSAEPPTAVVNLRVNSARTSNTSIMVLWEPPIGSSDYYYNVEYSDPDNVVTYRRHNQERITNTNAGTQTYTLTRLQPNTTYTIRVSVHNKVSGNDSQNDDRRRQQVSENTEEGG